jgi:hypothetical protein
MFMNDTEITTSYGVTLTSGMKQFVIWSAMLAAGAVGVSYLLFILYSTWYSEGWVQEVIRQHFAATVGLPLTGLATFLLVQVLQISAGQIELEVLGFKLRGASGPVVLWVVCFLTVTAALKLVW